MLPEELVRKVTEYKKKKKLTQGRLAKLIDVDSQYITYIEDGRISYVPRRILEKIEYTIDYLEDV